ncbi:MAG: amidase, partial [Rhizobiaceae bacterium]|nr:amidase [Rhizobiaceae bacterium]
MSEPLWSMDAVMLSHLLRSREIAPQEVLDSFAGRVAAVDPVVNALPTLCLDRARDRIATRSGLPATLLGGLPVPIKDSYPVEGVRTPYGS